MAAKGSTMISLYRPAFSPQWYAMTRTCILAALGAEGREFESRRSDQFMPEKSTGYSRNAVTRFSLFIRILALGATVGATAVAAWVSASGKLLDVRAS